VEKSVLDKKKCDKHEHERGAKEGFSEGEFFGTHIMWTCTGTPLR
jgi:hypothetical protein